MNNFLEKNKVIIDLIFKIIGLIFKIGLAAILSFSFKFFNITNTFLSNNSGIILLFIIFFLIFIVWDLRTIRHKLNLMILDDINIISDEETIFNGSKKYPKLPSAKAVSTYIHPTWTFDRQYYKELKNSKWIAHTEKITDNEAIMGGDYEFTKIFNIPFDIKKIKSAIIHIVVDDGFLLLINNTKIDDLKSANNTLNSYDVKKEIIKGENQIKFFVENTSFENYVKERPTSELAMSSDKYRHNPYGIRFCLEIKYIK